MGENGEGGNRQGGEQRDGTLKGGAGEATLSARGAGTAGCRSESSQYIGQGTPYDGRGMGIHRHWGKLHSGRGTGPIVEQRTTVGRLESGG